MNGVLLHHVQLGFIEDAIPHLLKGRSSFTFDRLGLKALAISYQEPIEEENVTLTVIPVLFDFERSLQPFLSQLPLIVVLRGA